MQKGLALSKSKGFTLIELLIVIGIIGVLAAVVLVGIDPVDKINAANDTKVIRDIGTLGKAIESYAVTHNGTYPSDPSGPNLWHNNAQQLLVNAGDLKAIISPPSGYDCSAGAPNYEYFIGRINNVTAAEIGCRLKSKKYTNQFGPNNTWWIYCSSSGKAGVVDGSLANPCP